MIFFSQAMIVFDRDLRLTRWLQIAAQKLKNTVKEMK